MSDIGKQYVVMINDISIILKVENVKRVCSSFCLCIYFRL